MGGKRTLEFAECFPSLVLCPKCDSAEGLLPLRMGKDGKQAPYLLITCGTSEMSEGWLQYFAHSGVIRSHQPV